MCACVFLRGFADFTRGVGKVSFHTGFSRGLLFCQSVLGFDIACYSAEAHNSSSH